MVKAEAGDPGFDARVKLYGFMANTWNKPGVTPLSNLWEVLLKNKDQLSTGGQPAGHDAPVSMGEMTGSQPSDNSESLTANERNFARRDLEGFIAAEMSKNRQ